MSDTEHTLQALMPGARTLVEAAIQKQQDEHHAELSVNHLLWALIDRHALMAENMTQGLDAKTLRPYLEEQLQQGNAGDAVELAAFLAEVEKRATARGKSRPAERDLATVILDAAGYEVIALSTSVDTSLSVPVTTVPAAGTDVYKPRSRRPTPTLEQFGRDLTREALDGALGPVVGREEEIQLMLETLCRRTKPNPCLVGPAGVGKTAIVEGLARRIVQGDVPEALQRTRLFAVQPSSLLAGAHMAGEWQERTRTLLHEAGRTGILLFIDEVHTLIGAGGMPGTADAASLFKPALARGDLACIAATTDDEYRRFIVPDRALARRFQPIRVQELSAEQTLEVLRAWRDALVRLRGVDVSDGVLDWLVHFARQYLRNRYFPDKAIDLLEGCVAWAVAEGRQTVTQEEAAAVARRTVGMPLALGHGLQALQARLAEATLLTEEQATTLLNRLEVTTRGLDLRPARPNSVVLLLGEAVSGWQRLAETIAEVLFGTADRVVSIDFSRFVHPADVTMLMGAPPGYVGYGDSLPLHRLTQTPWCVLVCQNVDACHPRVRQVLTRALDDGFLTEATGRRIYLSDTVVLLTAAVSSDMSRRGLGFAQLSGEQGAGKDSHAAATAALGSAFMAVVDLICDELPEANAVQQRWLEGNVLPDLAERYRTYGLDLSWDDSVVTWFLNRERSVTSRRDWERVVESYLHPLLIDYLPEAGGTEMTALRVTCVENTIQVEKIAA